MTERPLTARRGWLGARDDRARLLALVGASLGAAALRRLEPIAAAAALGLLLCVSTGISPREVARRAAPLLALVLLVFLLTPFTPVPGARPLLAEWPRGPSDLGLLLAATIALRVVAVTLLAIAALGTAPFERTLAALVALRVPALLVHTALLTYRTLFRFREDLDRVRAALAARGFAPGLDPRTVATYAGVSGGLLVRSVSRAERLERAMRCRGYEGEPVLEPPGAWRLADTALALGGLATGAALVAWERLALVAWPGPP